MNDRENVFAGQMNGIEHLFCRIVTLLAEINILWILNGRMKGYTVRIKGGE